MGNWSSWPWCEQNNQIVWRGDGTREKDKSAHVLEKLNESIQLCYHKRNHYINMMNNSLNDAKKAYVRVNASGSRDEVSAFTAREKFSRYKCLKDKVEYFSKITVILEQLVIEVDSAKFTATVLNNIDEGNKLLEVIQAKMQETDLEHILDTIKSAEDLEKNIANASNHFVNNHELDRELQLLMEDTIPSPPPPPPIVTKERQIHIKNLVH